MNNYRPSSSFFENLYGLSAIKPFSIEIELCIIVLTVKK